MGFTSATDGMSIGVSAPDSIVVGRVMLESDFIFVNAEIFQRHNFCELMQDMNTGFILMSVVGGTLVGTAIGILLSRRFVRLRMYVSSLTTAAITSFSFCSSCKSRAVRLRLSLVRWFSPENRNSLAPSDPGLQIANSGDSHPSVGETSFRLMSILKDDPRDDLVGSIYSGPRPPDINTETNHSSAAAPQSGRDQESIEQEISRLSQERSHLIEASDKIESRITTILSGVPMDSTPFRLDSHVRIGEIVLVNNHLVCEVTKVPSEEKSDFEVLCVSDECSEYTATFSMIRLISKPLQGTIRAGRRERQALRDALESNGIETAKCVIALESLAEQVREASLRQFFVQAPDGAGTNSLHSHARATTYISTKAGSQDQIDHIREEMRHRLTLSLTDRKDFYKALLLQYHPDKGPMSDRTNSEVIQFIFESKNWFLHD